VVQVSGRAGALPLRAAADLVAGGHPIVCSTSRRSYLDEERELRFEPLLRVEPPLRVELLLRAEPLLRDELRDFPSDELLLLAVPLRDEDRELALRLRLDDADRPPLFEARLGSFLRFTLAMS
jgi:hypothetical protein